MRPAKASRLWPGWPDFTSAAAPSLRPRALRVNAKRTLAGTLRSKLNVVPIGGRLFLARLKLASAFPSRQTRWVWEAWVILGRDGRACPRTRLLRAAFCP
jgi:hypothetical protein